MSCTIHKLTYSDGRAFRYHISDDAGNLRYVAERTGMLLPSQTHLVEFFDPDRKPSGRLQPPAVVPWQRATQYEVFVGDKTKEPYAVIRETWKLVDVLLLRLPRYEIQLGGHCYTVQGSRYGGHFYEIFLPCEEKAIEEADTGESTAQGEPEEVKTEEERVEPERVKVGQIQRPTAGPSYIVEADAAPLRQALLTLAAMVILIDMEMHSPAD